MTYTTVVAAMFDPMTFASDELPGWSSPSVAGLVARGLGYDFFASDDLPGWSHPSMTVAA